MTTDNKDSLRPSSTVWVLRNRYWIKNYFVLYQKLEIILFFLSQSQNWNQEKQQYDIDLIDQLILYLLVGISMVVLPNLVSRLSAAAFT